VSVPMMTLPRKAGQEWSNFFSCYLHNYTCISSSSSSSIVQCGRRRSSMSNPWWRCNIYT